MSSKKVKPEEKNLMDNSEDLHRTVELPAQEVKKALAQLQAVAASEKEERENGDGESFEAQYVLNRTNRESKLSEL